MPKKLPAPIRVDATPRARLTVYAIGAAHRAGGMIGATIALDAPFIFDEATHIVRTSNAGDAMRAHLAHTDSRVINRWPDDDCNQRLLYVIPVERLMFCRPTAANIEVSATHRRDDGAPIRYLRG